MGRDRVSVLIVDEKRRLDRRDSAVLAVISPEYCLCGQLKTKGTQLIVLAVAPVAAVCVRVAGGRQTE
jgi:hypothetical protein